MQSVEIDATPEGYERGLVFIGELLRRNRIAETIIDETQLVYEALYYNIIGQAEGKDVHITITNMGRFGDIRIRIGFEGKMYIHPDASGFADDQFFLENSILRAYSDKIDYTYNLGRNNIFIYVKRNYSRTFFACMAAAAVAVLIYVVLNYAAGQDTQVLVLKAVIYPVELLFTNAMLMLAAPVTFFSLLKNLTDTYILSANESGLRKLQRRIVITSVSAIMLAIAVSLVIHAVWRQNATLFEGYDSILNDTSAIDLINALIPSSILEPFETMSPFPLIFVAVLTTAAFCSSIKYFDVIKKITDVCYALFSRMLTIVMSLLPLAFCSALVDILCRNGKESLQNLIIFIALVILSPAALALIMVLELKAGGVGVIDFCRKIHGMIGENIKINSGIDAVQYNIRYCSRAFGMDRKRLGEQMQVLSQINLCGNCYLITLISMLLLFFNRTDVSYLSFIFIGILVLFLSMGAPNQPGGILLALVIIFNYMSVPELLPIAIGCEVFFGWLQNLINVTGDIVTIASFGGNRNEKAG